MNKFSYSSPQIEQSCLCAGQRSAYPVRCLNRALLATLALGAVSQQALAANECGTVAAGGAAICNGDNVPLSDASPYIAGIQYTVDGVTVVLDGAADPLVIAPVISTHGVRNFGGGSGERVVEVNGDVSITALPGTASANVGGVLVSGRADGGATARINGGTITTTGSHSFGVVVDTYGAGTATVAMTAGSVSTAAGVSGSTVGLFAEAKGRGDAAVTMDGGSVTTLSSHALYALARGDGTASATQNAGSISTQVNGGIVAQTLGAGDAVAIQGGGTVNINGASGAVVAFASGDGDATARQAGGEAIVGPGGYGLGAVTFGAGHARVEQQSGGVTDASAAVDGILARALGTGTYSVSAGGTVLGGSNAAIHSVGAAGGVVDILASANIDAGSGTAIRDGDRDYNGVDEIGGDTVISTAGTVKGAAVMGRGDDTLNLSGGSFTGDIFGDDRAAAATDGNDIFNWTNGVLDGGFYGQNGSDTANISSAKYDGSQILNGGDDIGTADGWTDTFNLNNWSGNVVGANVRNWEIVNINGGSVGVGDAAIVAGTVNVNGGGTFDGSNNLVATADVNVSSGSTLVAGNTTGTNAMLVSGNLTNNGTVDMRGPAGQEATGDRLTVGGGYSGGAGSQIAMDVVLGDDSSTADRLIVNGDASGITGIVVNNIGGGGALTTGDGIKLVRVDGTSAPGSFALANGPAIAGAYRYDLYEGGAANPNDEDWYLRSRTRDIVTPLISIARTAQNAGLNMLGTLHERVGEQEHLGQQPSAQGGAPGGLWGRVLGSDFSDTAKSAAFGNSRTNGQFGAMQMGLDLYRGASDSGSRTHIGFYGGHLWSGTREYQVTPQRLYAGTTNSDGWVAGLYATHYAASGWYADAVLQGSWLDHKAKATDGTTFKTDSKSWLASIELGKPFELGSSFKLEPQVQLIYSSTDLDDAADSAGILNVYNVEDSLIGRLGFRLKRTWGHDQANGDGLFTAYLKANVWNTLSGGDTGLTVGNSTKGFAQYRAVWGDVGFGSTFSLHENVEFFVDADVEFGLNKGATALSGHTGVRVRF